MRPSQPEAQTILARAARIGAAALLVLALLSGIAPLKSLSFASPSLCSMSCCIALPPHRPGECASVASCPVSLPGHSAAAHETPEAAHADRHAAAESHSHSDENAQHQESQPQPTAHHAAHHTAHAGTHHAATQEASQTSQASALQPESKTPDSKQPHRSSSIAPASISNPCPSDCGMAAGSFGNRLRSRDAATLAQTHRPRRPPARVVTLRRVSLLPLISAGKHRLAPPRAPPLIPASDSPTT